MMETSSLSSANIESSNRQSVSSEEDWELLSGQQQQQDFHITIEVEEDLMLVEETESTARSTGMNANMNDSAVIVSDMYENENENEIMDVSKVDEKYVDVDVEVEYTSGDVAAATDSENVNVSCVNSSSEVPLLEEERVAFDDGDIPILPHDDNFLSGVVAGFGQASRDVSRAAIRFSEHHKLQERTQEVTRHVGGAICVVGNHTQEAVKHIGGAACLVGEHVGGAANVLGEQAAIVGTKTHQGLIIAAERIRDFEEQHHTTDAIASAMVFFGASSFATGHITRGISALGVAVAAHTLGVGMRNTRGQDQQSYHHSSQEASKEMPC